MLDPTATRFGQSALLSELMNAEDLRACWLAIPAEKREEPEHLDRRLARQAVQSSALTLWQAQQLLAGRSNGFKVDRYVLLELIGQGGMGRVYLALDTRLNRRVALKILAPERISNPRAVARFRREARVGAQLQHENLVRVYDFGESNGRFFLVMEHIAGNSIGGLISSKGRLPPTTAARLARQVAQALDHAHQKGMIHRDVNPYNVMVTSEGVAKLADLGLAIDLAEVSERVTRDGATVGTFDYVAPEQARHSHSADIRSDIYSLGCSIYHMLTGHVPFPSPSLPEKLFAHQAMEPEPLEQAVPDLPPGLGDVVRIMMRKQPEERYATPIQVVRALEPFAGEVSAPGAERAHRFASGAGSGERPAGASSGSSHAIPIPIEAGRAGAGATATRRTPVSSESDDPRIPLLTPTEEASDDFGGLSIVLDLGPDPPLREPAARSRPGASGGLASLFRSPAPDAAAESATVGVAVAAPSRSRARLGSLPAWSRLAIPAGVAAVAMIVVLGMTGRLTPLWGGAPANSSRTPKSSGGRDGRPGTPRAEAPAIVVRGDGGPDEGDGAAARTLADAIKAAMGTTRYVELRDRGPIRLEPGDLPDLHTGRGSLQIRAAAGHRPVIEVQMDSHKPWLATGSAVSLFLSGLTIRVRPPEAGAVSRGPAVVPTVIEAAGSIRLDRCSFEVVGNPSGTGVRALASEGGTLTVDRCWFRGFSEAIGIQAFDKTVATIEETMIVPATGAASAPLGSSERRGWAIALHVLRGGSRPASKRHLRLDHCTVDGDGLLTIDGDAGPSPMPVDVAHCAVRVGAILAWKPRRPGGRLDADIRWKGTGNQLNALSPSWVVMSAAAMTPELSIGVTDLASWSKFVTREVDPIRTRIQYPTVRRRRGEPPQPSDFEIESSRALDDRAGADPERVGPGGK